MNLYEIAQLSFDKVFPKSAGKAPIDLMEFQRTAINEFAYQSLLMAWKEKADDGYFDIPGYLLTEVEKEIVNDEMDISDLKYFKSLPLQIWLVNIGGLNCHCKYIKSDVNLTALLCEDNSLDDSAKTYYHLGKKIVFPQGAHTSPLKIIYANIGQNIDGKLEVDEALGALVRERLDNIYTGKVAPADVTNNQNPNG